MCLLKGTPAPKMRVAMAAEEDWTSRRVNRIFAESKGRIACHFPIQRYTPRIYFVDAPLDKLRELWMGIRLAWESGTPMIKIKSFERFGGTACEVRFLQLFEKELVEELLQNLTESHM